MLQEGKLTKKAILKIISGGTPAVTMDQAFEEYRTWHAENSPSARTTDNYIAEITAFMRANRLENKPVQSVTDRMVNAWVNPEDSSLKAGTRHVKLAALRKFFWLASVKNYVPYNPAKIIQVKYHLLTHKQKETKVKECFTDAEIERLLDATSLDPFWWHAVVLGRYTGLRLSDICQLEWACLDVPGKLKVWTDKSDTPVELVLEPEILAESVRHIPQHHKLYCFPKERAIINDTNRRAGLSVKFTRLCAKVGIKSKSFHCLRHTYATEAKRTGKPMDHIRKDLGHSSDETTKIYVH